MSESFAETEGEWSGEDSQDDDMKDLDISLSPTWRSESPNSDVGWSPSPTMNTPTNHQQNNARGSNANAESSTPRTRIKSPTASRKHGDKRVHRSAERTGQENAMERQRWVAVDLNLPYEVAPYVDPARALGQAVGTVMAGICDTAKADMKVVFQTQVKALWPSDPPIPTPAILMQATKKTTKSKGDSLGIGNARPILAQWSPLPGSYLRTMQLERASAESGVKSFFHALTSLPEMAKRGQIARQFVLNQGRSEEVVHVAAAAQKSLTLLHLCYTTSASRESMAFRRLISEADLQLSTALSTIRFSLDIYRRDVSQVLRSLKLRLKEAETKALALAPSADLQDLLDQTRAVADEVRGALLRLGATHPPAQNLERTISALLTSAQRVKLNAPDTTEDDAAQAVGRDETGSSSADGGEREPRAESFDRNLLGEPASQATRLSRLLRALESSSIREILKLGDDQGQQGAKSNNPAVEITPEQLRHQRTQVSQLREKQVVVNNRILEDQHLLDDLGRQKSAIDAETKTGPPAEAEGWGPSAWAQSLKEREEVVVTAMKEAQKNLQRLRVQQTTMNVRLKRLGETLHRDEVTATTRSITHQLKDRICKLVERSRPVIAKTMDVEHDLQNVRKRLLNASQTWLSARVKEALDSIDETCKSGLHSFAEVGNRVEIEKRRGVEISKQDCSVIVTGLSGLENRLALDDEECFHAVVNARQLLSRAVESAWSYDRLKMFSEIVASMHKFETGAKTGLLPSNPEQLPLGRCQKLGAVQQKGWMGG